MADTQHYDYCQLPGCWALFAQTPGPGRPRRYCSDEHRNEAHNMRRRTEARLTHLRELVRRDEHLLAALGEAPASEEASDG